MNRGYVKQVHNSNAIFQYFVCFDRIHTDNIGSTQIKNKLGF